ncbi:hypothetical protein NM688_g1812 [Phlebia brevispora]|uniref:Uncharacterized protein n=1 Tax=Phlebia brevispora TaxID=194682 RepID=A0ACC1TAM3_9APHY|nr:hypothetical protein NM688_g1812 [Phlebia brevispora]
MCDIVGADTIISNLVLLLQLERHSRRPRFIDKDDCSIRYQQTDYECPGFTTAGLGRDYPWELPIVVWQASVHKAVVNQLVAFSWRIAFAHLTYDSSYLPYLTVNLPARMDALSVPTADIPGHDVAEPYLPGRRSRPVSIAGSLATSNTLTSTQPGPSIPLMSGGPYSDRARAHSAVSLRGCIPGGNASRTRLPQSHSQLSFGSGDYNIEVIAPDGTPDVAIQNHDTAPPQDILPDPMLPIRMEEHKYAPRYLPKDIEDNVDWVDAVTLEYSDATCPQGWEQCVGPEGDVYYHHAERRIYTVSDVNNPDILTWINRSYQQLQVMKASINKALPEDSDTALCFEVGGYYMISWKQKIVFWLHGVNPRIITSGERKVLSLVHLGHKMRSEFWRHVLIFPHFYELSHEYVEELRATLTFGHADVLTSETSLFPYDSGLLESIQRLIDKFPAGSQGPARASYMSALARFQYHIEKERFLNYHGERYARLDRSTSLYEPPPVQTWGIFNFASALLFFLPDWYLAELRKVYVDKTVHYYSWRRLIGELKKDWESSLTPTTVLLSANIGFLAIQSVDNVSTNVRSLAQIASYVSALFSLAGYVVVQLLMRRHRLALYDTAERGLEYLSGRDETVGLQTLAICISLPGAFFVWSVLSFFLALAFIFFHKSTTPAITTTAVAAILLAVMIGGLFISDFLGDNTREFDWTWWSQMKEYVVYSRIWRSWNPRWIRPSRSRSGADNPVLPTTYTA